MLPPRLLLDLLLIALTLLAYVPAMRAGYIWDDQMFITENKALLSVSGLRQIWLEPRANPHYYPLLLTVFWLMHRLWDIQPFGYHAVNILIHIGAALLLRRLLERLRVPGAAFGAMVFALHPIYVSSVAWVTELKNTLSGFFYLAALWAWVRGDHVAGIKLALPSDEKGGAGFIPATMNPAADSRRKAGSTASDSTMGISPPGRAGFIPATNHPGFWFKLSLLFFAGALLSKTTTVSFLLAVPLIEWWRSDKVHRTTWRRLAWPFALALGLGALTLWVEQSRNPAPTEAAFPLTDRWMAAGRSLWFYLGKFLWPARLTMIYPKWVVGSMSWLPLAGVLVAFVLLWALRKRIGRGPVACAAFFVFTLAPIPFLNIGFVLQQSFVADHFFYLPGLALIAAVSAGAAALGRRIRPPALAKAGAAAVILLLAGLSGRHAGVFHDQVTLWRDNLAKFPDLWVVKVNLGVALAQQGQDEEARGLFAEAIAVAPHDPRAHWNLADSFRRHGQLEKAEEHYLRVLELTPGDAETYMYLGEIQMATGRPAEAVASYVKVCQGWPWSSVARHRLGSALLRLGRSGEARQAFDDALSKEPDNPDLMSNVARLLATHPDDGFRDGAKALPLADRACKLTFYSNALYMDTLAAACAEIGRFPDARRIARQAVDLAERAGNKSLADAARQRLALYRSNQPYREPGP